MIGNFWGNFEKLNSYAKTALVTFQATFGKFGLLFTPTSGHTDYKKKGGRKQQDVLQLVEARDDSGQVLRSQ